MIEIWRTRVGRSDESQRAYDEIYSHQGIQLPDSFYMWLLDLLHPEPGRQLLDVSCGHGALVRFAHQREIIAYGLDFSSAAICRARTITGAPCFLTGDGSRLPFADATFDYATCIGSLEHFVDPLAGMREIARTLRGHGTACILVPNTFSLFGNVEYARKHGEIFDDGQPIQRYNTRMGWTRMLEQSGLNVQHVDKFEITKPRTRTDWAWILRRPRKVAHLLAALMIPVNLANSHTFICTRAGHGSP